MLIVVEKIITEYKKDNQGNTIRNPVNNRPTPDGFKIEREAICLDEVKAVRVWHKSKYQKENLLGDVTALYMFNRDSEKDARGSKAAEIHINESFESFNSRAKSILIKDEQEAK